MKNDVSLNTIKKRYNIIGHSETLNQALARAIRVANTDLTVLLIGPSGVGKEIFSQVIHGLSPRKHNKFIAVNCGAIPSGTINSELFGHEKGAYTGATADRKGYFETVNGGTIFLDEIGEMPLDTQAYLLRILESGEFIRVGSSKVQKTDVRIIAATNQNLEDQVFKGKFREDLYYRLNTIIIPVPPLSERREDIYMLFRKFAMDFSEKYKTETVHLTADARKLLEHYSWPGNIRELKNLTEQLSILNNSSLIDADELVALYPKIADRNLPSKIHAEQNQSSLYEREILYKLLFDMKSDLNDLKATIFGLIQRNNLIVDETTRLRVEPTDLHPQITTNHPYTSTSLANLDIKKPEENKAYILHTREETLTHTEVEDENLSIEAMEKELIKKALKRYRGKRKEAADELGISERTLYRKIKQYEL